MLVYKKAEVLLTSAYPILRNFPKSEKYALTQQIKQAFYQLLQSIILASNVRHKRREYQTEADGYNKLLLVYFNLAYKLGYLNKSTHYRLTAGVEEVGRLLGGWIKQT